MVEPKNNRGKSEQSVETPDDFIRAVEERFGHISFDLAAEESNQKAKRWEGMWYGEGEDSLKQDWTKHNGLLWLNPEFGNIRPWAKKCVESMDNGRLILMLTPLSSSCWATEFCHQHAHVIGLNGRIKFVGHKWFFPKDLILSVFGWPPGFSIWNWRGIA